MAKRISALSIRAHLGDLLNRVHLRDEQFVVERKGKPLAAIVPVWQLEKWQREKAAWFKKVDEVRARTAGVPPALIEEEVQEAKRVSRKR